MFKGLNNTPPKIKNDDLRDAVRSRNMQSNSDTWEINITLVIVALALAGVVIFQAELHDLLTSIYLELR